MKIAIIGGGPLGICLAALFLKERAHVNVFTQQTNLSSHYQDMDTHEKIHELLSEYATIQSKNADSLYLNIFKNLADVGAVKNYRVRRVQKRLLGPYEVPEKTSRFIDLFRVTCLTYPESDEVDLSFLENEHDKEKIKKNLESPIEIFFDYDIVIDTNEEDFELYPLPRIINESILNDREMLSYNNDSFSLMTTLEDNKEITLIDEGSLTAQGLYFLEKWLDRSSKNIVNIVTREKSFLNSHCKNQDQIKKIRLSTIIDKYFQKWKAECAAYEKELFEWRNLDIDARSRLEKPVETLPQLRLYQAYSATSFDFLEDQKKIFVTCETDSFRSNQLEAMVTISSDHVFIFRDPRRDLFNQVSREYDQFGNTLTNNDLQLLERGLYFISQSSDYRFAREYIDRIVRSIGLLFQRIDS